MSDCVGQRGVEYCEYYYTTALACSRSQLSATLTVVKLKEDPAHWTLCHWDVAILPQQLLWSLCISALSARAEVCEAIMSTSLQPHTGWNSWKFVSPISALQQNSTPQEFQVIWKALTPYSVLFWGKLGKEGKFFTPVISGEWHWGFSKSQVNEESYCGGKRANVKMAINLQQCLSSV